MKNTIKILGIISLTLLITLTLASCKNETETTLEGIWVSEYDEITFNEVKSECKGTYATSGSTLTATITDIWGPSISSEIISNPEARWYTIAEYKAVVKQVIEDMGQTWTSDMEKNFKDMLTVQWTYVINGNTLILTEKNGYSITYTKS